MNESIKSRNRLIQTSVALLFFALPFLCGVLFLPQPDIIPILSGLEGISVHELTVAAQDNHSVFYATSNVGIFRSDDGVHWKAVNDGLPLKFREGIIIKTLIVDPRDSAVVYVLTSNSDDAVELYRTTNGGKNWQPLTLPADPIVFEDTLTPASNQDVATLYLLGSGGIYQSHDGQSWKLCRTVPKDVQPQTLAVKDSDSSTIFYLGTQGNGILRSGNEGDAWEPSATGLENQSVQRLLVSPANSNVLFALADQKIYRSIDAGQSWQFAGQGLETQQITSMVAHPSQESVLYVGTKTGQVLVTANTGDTWESLGDRIKNVSVQALALDQDSVRVATNNGIWQYDLELPPDVTPATAVAAVSPTETPTSTPPPSATPTAKPTATPTAIPTATATPTPSPSPTPPPTHTSAPPTATETPTHTPLPPPTHTPLPPPTDTPLPTPTHTPPPPPTHTPKPTPTATPTARPTVAPTPTYTATPTPTPTPTNTPASPTPTITPGGPRPTMPGGTVAPSHTPTSTPTITPTVAPTSTPTAMPTITPTSTPITLPTGMPPVTPSPPPDANLGSPLVKAPPAVTTKHPSQHNWTVQTSGYALDQETERSLTPTHRASAPLNPPIVAIPATRQALSTKA